MTRISSIRVLITLALVHNLVIHQMDVKTAFLNGELGNLYGSTQGCMVPGDIKKSIGYYGLKQAPKQWHSKFDHVLISNGFFFNDVDKCIYNKVENNSCIIICLYIGDMLIFRTNLQVVINTKSFLRSKFDMKDLEEAEVILGIKITGTLNGLNLSQEHYIENI